MFSYRHNQVFFVTRDLLWHYGDEIEYITEGKSLNTFRDVLIKQHHKQFYDNNQKMS
jgi:hypothetical protein